MCKFSVTVPVSECEFATLLKYLKSCWSSVTCVTILSASCSTAPCGSKTYTMIVISKCTDGYYYYGVTISVTGNGSCKMIGNTKGDKVSSPQGNQPIIVQETSYCQLLAQLNGCWEKENLQKLKFTIVHAEYVKDSSCTIYRIFVIIEEQKGQFQIYLKIANGNPTPTLVSITDSDTSATCKFFVTDLYIQLPLSHQSYPVTQIDSNLRNISIQSPSQLRQASTPC